MNASERPPGVTEAQWNELVDKAVHEAANRLESKRRQIEVAQRSMTTNGGPWWAGLIKTIGIGGLIAIYLLGMIPGMRSPIDKILEGFTAVAAAVTAHDTATAAQLRQHDQTTRELKQVNVLICQGLWRGSPDMQRQCAGTVPLP